MTLNPILFFPAEPRRWRNTTWLEQQAAAQLIELARAIAINGEEIHDYTLGSEVSDDNFFPYIVVEHAAHYGESRWQELDGRPVIGGYLTEVTLLGNNHEHVCIGTLPDPDAIPTVVDGA